MDRQRTPARPGKRLLLGALLLAGCAAQDPARLGHAAATPLTDLNLLQSAIPAVLQQAQRAPYARPEPADCAALQQQLATLDEVLGPDLDQPANASNPGLLARGGELADDAAMGALQRTAEGIVPFRGWVRKLTGAEQHSRMVTAAITAGGVRRGFLKGLRVAQGC